MPLTADASDAVVHVENAVAALRSSGPVVLAVSGGTDSMALLHAAAAAQRGRIATVATFDHGTGDHATAAAALVVSACRQLGLPVVRQRAVRPATTEAAWRDARWAFLTRVARAHDAVVVTAHTRDDQLETVVQRLLRGTGTRGLASLAAPGSVLRPFLELTRADLAAYVQARGIPTVLDPGNADRRHQRVRVRLDLLPALERAAPGVGAELLALAARAAEWRRELAGLVRSLGVSVDGAGVLRVPRASLSGWSADALAMVWPELLSAVGVVLSQHGTRALVRFTIGDSAAGVVRLAGGGEVVASALEFVVRGPHAAGVAAAARCAGAASHGEQVVGGTLVWPGWRLCPVRSEASGGSGPEWAVLPAGASVVVRPWRPADRIATRGAPAGRRVSRYLAEAGVAAADRPGWPVVAVGGDILWVPGVCRGVAASPQSINSPFIWYRSERDFA